MIICKDCMGVVEYEMVEHGYETCAACTHKANVRYNELLDAQRLLPVYGICFCCNEPLIFDGEKNSGECYKCKMERVECESQEELENTWDL